MSPQQQGSGGQIQHRTLDGAVDWNQEFSRQMNLNGGPSVMQGQPLQNGSMQQYNNPAMGMGMGMNQYSNFQTPQENYQAQQQPMEQFDDEAFERAFQEAAANAQADTHQEIQEQINTQEQADNQLQTDAQMEDPFEDLASFHTPLENKPLDLPLIGADTIHDPNHPDEERQKEDPDALARTAQQLIHNLSGDTSSKMQGSEFMKLMRGFAAGTSVVRGDDVVGLEGESVGDGGSLKVV